MRGNAAEIASLAGVESTISWVESLSVEGDVANIASELAREYRCVAAVTGAVDVVTDGERLVYIANGHPMMSSVTSQRPGMRMATWSRPARSGASYARVIVPEDDTLQESLVEMIQLPCWVHGNH